jgi:hypothetical protein
MAEIRPATGGRPFLVRPAKDVALIVRRLVGESFSSDGGGGTPVLPSVVAEQLDRCDE